jgi:hypothetical protein
VTRRREGCAVNFAAGDSRELVATAKGASSPGADGARAEDTGIRARKFDPHRSF